MTITSYFGSTHRVSKARFVSFLMAAIVAVGMGGVFITSSVVQAADTGVKYPGTVTTISEGIYNDENWNSPGNVNADDGNEASVTASSFDNGDETYLLRATNFSLNVPVGSVIQGIKVEVERKNTAGSSRDALVQLTKNGTARVGSDKANTSTNWPSVIGVATYGGSADLWGTTWTRDEVNAATFGVHFAARAHSNNTNIYVDFIRVTVYYTVSTPSVTILPTSLPGGTVGTFFSQTLTASTTATGTFTWSLASGSLPAGLSLATSATGTLSSITGTPTTAATSTFSVKVTNGTSSSTQSYTVGIAPAPMGTLVVKKVLVNDNGGTAATSSFSFQVNGGAPISFNTNGTNVLSVASGTYTVTEIAAGGYATTYSNCSGVPVNGGATSTCTITNNDIAPTLTVTKIVQNNDGGTLAVGDFPLFVNGNPVTSGVTSTYAAGTYTVSETNQSGYVGTFGGDCNASGTVTLALGEVKSCTITNDDIAPGLTVVKQVVNDNGGTAQVSDFTLYVGTTTATSGQTMTLPAGTYTVSESGGPSGYTASFSGDCDANGNVTLAVGATSTYTCVITNDDVEPKLTVTKIVLGGTAQISDFPLFVGATQVTSSQQYGFSAGSYTVSEIAGNLPYFATFGGDCASNGSITLAPGDVRSCTITNEYLAPPTASPAGGTYNDPQSVTLSSTGPVGTTVRYTTDGSMPSCTSAEYASPISITGDSPLRAVACYGSVQSSPIWENYVIGPHSSGAGQTGGGEVLGVSTSTEGGGGNSTSTATSTATSTKPFVAPLVEVLGASTEAPVCVAEGEYLRDYLWYGRPNDREQVKKLQTFLNNKEGAALPVTGFFGTLTRAAVSAFQVKYAADILTPWGETRPTGNVYKTTKWKINSLWCPALELTAPSVP